MQTGIRISQQAGKAPPRAFTDADTRKFIKRGYDALHAGQFDGAGNCCALVLKYKPKEVAAHFLVGLVSIEQGKWSMARQAFQNTVSLDESHDGGWAQLARTFVVMGQYGNAHKALEKATALSPKTPLVMDIIGTVYSLLGEQEAALHWYDGACARSDGPLFQLSRAKSLTFLGKLPEAKAALSAVLKASPDSAQAHWMLSRIQKAKDKSHIADMQGLIASKGGGAGAAPFLHYAIGKEYEDLEEWHSAFKSYELGAKARRVEVDYDEAAEEALFEALVTRFTPDWLAGVGAGQTDDSPIFIIGQPRTGTTLVERIITAHSDVHSAGELQQFGMAIKRTSGVNSPRPMTAEMVEKAASMDMQALGQAYLDSIKSVRGDKPRFVDKMPVNYLYAPLIAAALPNARIVHIVRDPLDSCVSSYKQLFADAYFHSYDQAEMARHHVRYRKLMDHWRSVLGDRMLDVHYEDVATDLRPNAERIIAHLGLEWQDSCAEFHKQNTAVTTASAAQVREKAHTRSIGRWRKFEEFLTPMKNILSEAGVLSNQV